MTPLLVAALAGLSVVALIYTLFLPDVAQEAAVTRRIRALAARAPDAAPRGSAQEEVAQLMKANAAKSGARGTLRLGALIDQADIGWTRAQVLLAAAAFGAAVALVCLAVFEARIVAPLAGVAAAILAPILVLRHLRDRRFARFAEELPNALDLIARGVRAGRPINDCIHTAARETRDPVRREFRIVEDEQQLGASLSEAVDRMATRVPIDETRFLSIAIAVQSAEGGAIAETLMNLSHTLRERRRLAKKISSMMAEQTASAKFLALLPFAMLGFTIALNREQAKLMFTTFAGQATLVGVCLWVLLGFLVLARMTRVRV
ncbi:type II secretion system F family protein [Aquabacter spiritensis]|uniref:Tight adherence protein B n=1 Tax=Aquabacter spiritensis TaxID=933073 RepID=A0A4R3M4K3_9HYPH|nr:type II secretion system F family protein [Aquabacter spiritensis]TCT07513.1 tight adherence protein B [Aquabacter spiritensis]